MEKEDTKVVKKWVYKTVDGSDCKINIKPSGSQPLFNGQHMIGAIKTKSMFLKFVNGFCVIDKNYALRSPIIDQSRTYENQEDDLFAAIIALIENQPSFGKSFICIQSPDRAMTPEEIKAVEKTELSARKSKNKVLHGDRT